MSSPKIYQVSNLQTSLNNRVLKAGDTITGELKLLGSGVSLNVANTGYFSGNVGIGTSNPTAKLYVTVANDGGDALYAAANNTNGIVVVRPDGANGAQFRYGGDGSNANILRFIGVGETEHVRISAGNVGIGTTSPLNKFHVAGSGTVARFSSSTTDGAITISHAGNGGIIGYLNNGAGALSNMFYITTGAATFGSGIVMNNDGNVGIGTTSFNTNGGKLQVADGISFPATQSACSDANTLDDYEEGTWTPTSVVNGFTQTISSLSGKYTKIGRFVQVEMNVTLSSFGRPTNYSQFGGLPFSITDTPVGVFGGGNPGTGIQGGSIIGSISSVFWYPTNGAVDSGAWYASMGYMV